MSTFYALLCKEIVCVDHEYVFDEVFDESASNADVYQRTAKPLVDIMFNQGKVW